MKSVMTNQEYFAKAASPKISRSTFDRSHGHKTTLDAGLLIPIYIDEALPGDTFSMKATTFGRFATPLKPVMDNMYVDLHFFSVPIRLVWDNFKKFMGEQDNPGDSIDYTYPTVTSPSGGHLEGTLFDYAGIPTKVGNLTHRSDILRAYQLIYDEWYRDENLQDSVLVGKGDGPDADSAFSVLPRGKRKDYFTSALPFAQKGEVVSIPLGSTAAIKADTTGGAGNTAANEITVQRLDGTAARLYTDGTYGYLAASDSITDQAPMYADLSNATAATINQLREAFSIQRFYEISARGGSRYTETIQSHFSVLSPDMRLQRPEFLGGSTTSVNISPVAQTSASVEDGTAQANLAAIGTFGNSVGMFTKSFTEHEIVIGIASVRADLTYQTGLNRMWSRKTRFDNYWPSLANLGEQAILNSEIYAQGADVVDSESIPVDEGVFGYAERYAEYRFKPSLITGLFRSNADESLDVWHLSQDFSELPLLNEEFIKEQPPIDRVVAVTDEPNFILDAYFDLKCTRPMPVYAVPSLMNHF